MSSKQIIILNLGTLPFTSLTVKTYFKDETGVKGETGYDNYMFLYLFHLIVWTKVAKCLRII